MGIPSTRIPTSSSIKQPGFWLVLGMGLALKAAILLSNSITFDADEAILGLMARHILQGQFPLFFYGQSYMGALDAYLTVPFFAALGQTVLAMRLLQLVLYVAVLITTYHLALRLTADRFAAFGAALLVAIPPVLFSLYTSSTLGNYVEVLLFNNLLLILGWDIFEGRKDRAKWWLAAGLLGGLGWWAMALIIVSLAPLTLLGVWQFRRRIPWMKTVVLVVGFLLGASPWIYATLVRGATVTISDLAGSWFSGPGTLADHLLALILFNLPALFGLRPPWSVDWIVLPVGLAVAAFDLFVLWKAGAECLEPPTNTEPRRVRIRTLMTGWALLPIVFLLTPFGGDPTGRYLLPLYPYLAILVGDRLAWLRGVIPKRGVVVASTILAVFVLYNLWGNVRAMIENPPGLSKQFDPITQIPHDHDADLVRFLDSIGVSRGYSNTWVTFRFAFLTGERIIFSPRLPYKADLSYTYGDDRYAPYSDAVAQSPDVVYVTSNHPLLDQRIAARLTQLGVRFEQRRIGPYTVFYHLSRKVTPDEMGPFGVVFGRAVHN